MDAFIMHIGHNNKIDIDYTIKRKRTIDEMRSKLPEESDEYKFFISASFRAAFPDGQFNCWGVPVRAEPAFRETKIGDLVLFAPWIGIHGGGIHYIGIVKAIYPYEANFSSRIFWPATPNNRLFPWIYFFDTESGNRGWYDFLDDIGISHGWNPRGWYKKIQPERFARFGGVSGYVDFLRSIEGGSFLKDG